jgi:CheY-like chemotaxis protein
VETTRQYIEAQEHKLEVDITPQALVITADPVRLEQVFSNLLNNAAKYTPRGGDIRIAAARERNEVVVRVKDTGIGIPVELLPRIFDLFVQEKYSVGQEPGGLGLGLTLVRNIVTLHGGTVEAQSAGRGHGSEFIVRLPIGSERTQTELSRELPPLIQTRSTDPKRVLVVDDREEQIRAMRMVLERMGHTVRVASDATAALAILAEHPTDVALIDIGLAGGIDGYEVARRIRQQPDLKNTLLIAATGWGRDIDRRRSQDAGFDYHLVKPIDWQLLREILDNHRSKG